MSLNLSTLFPLIPTGAPQQPQPQQQGFSFGGAPAAPGGFGAPAPAPAAFGAFGAPQTTGFGAPAPAPAFSGFGIQAAPAPAPGGFGGFGQAAPSAPATAGGFGAFGAAPQTSGADDFECKPSPSGNTDSVCSISWSPDGRFLATGGWDNKVHMFQVNRDARNQNCTGVSYVMSTDVGAPVLDHVWSAESNAVYIVGCNNKVNYWNLSTPQSPSTELGSHAQPIRAIHRATVGGSNCLVTGSWDKTLSYWDPRTPRQLAKVQLDERVYAMDVNRSSMVVALGGQTTRKVCIFDLSRSHDRPLWELPSSPLKFQTRCVRIFHDLNNQGRPQSFAISSIEGRCAIRRLDQGEDTALDGQGKPKFSFAFKCHRDESATKLIYAVNSVDCHPNHTKFGSVFATGGSDGIITTWDKDQKQRITPNVNNPFSYLTRIQDKQHKTPVTDMKFSPDGNLLAYAISYDWSKGHEFNDQRTLMPQVFVHNLVEDGELIRPKAKGFI